MNTTDKKILVENKLFTSETKETPREVYKPSALCDEDETYYKEITLKDGQKYKHIDTVYYDRDIKNDDVRKSLISHDGYAPYILISSRP